MAIPTYRLLTQLVDFETNTLVTDHHWFAFTKGFEKAQIKRRRYTLNLKRG